MTDLDVDEYEFDEDGIYREKSCSRGSLPGMSIFL